VEDIDSLLVLKRQAERLFVSVRLEKDERLNLTTWGGSTYPEEISRLARSLG
jgi:hypothetical protein